MELYYGQRVNAFAFVFVLTANDFIMAIGCLFKCKIMLNYSGNMGILVILLMVFDIVLDSNYNLRIIGYIMVRIFVTLVSLLVANETSSKTQNEENKKKIDYFEFEYKCLP